MCDSKLLNQLFYTALADGCQLVISKDRDGDAMFRATLGDSVYISDDAIEILGGICILHIKNGEGK